MNNWNFNELTQQDQFDFKACQRQDKTVYGVPDKSDCQKGKEITKEQIQQLAVKANNGDKAASDLLKQVSAVNREQESKAKKAKAEEKKKKKAEAGEKGKKGKKGGGKGKKGGGKGKKGGAAAETKQTKSAQSPQQRRKAAIDRARETVSKLQKMLRTVTDPKAKQQIQTAISELLKSAVDATKASPSELSLKSAAPTPSSPPSQKDES